MQEHILWYNKPATNWNEALPLGNGFMGAMCFGGTLVDRYQLNLDSLWHGTFRDRINPDAKESIPVIRKLIREGRITEAGLLKLLDDAISAYDAIVESYDAEETLPDAA